MVHAGFREMELGADQLAEGQTWEEDRQLEVDSWDGRQTGLVD